MNLMSRLTADGRRAHQLRQARAAHRRAVAKRQRFSDPGYDELSNPRFVALLLLAVAVIVLDIRGDIDSSVPINWLRSVAMIARASL